MKPMRNPVSIRIRVPLLLFLILCLTGCAATEQTQSKITPETAAMLMVKVYYKERASLPQGSKLTVLIEDISKLDTKSRVIAGQSRFVKGGPPFTMNLRYNPKRIDKRFSYSLQAVIEVKGQIMFANTSRINPFKDTEGRLGSAPVEVLVQKRGR